MFKCTNCGHVAETHPDPKNLLVCEGCGGVDHWAPMWEEAEEPEDETMVTACQCCARAMGLATLLMELIEEVRDHTGLDEEHPLTKVMREKHGQLMMFPEFWQL